MVRSVSVVAASLLAAAASYGSISGVGGMATQLFTPPVSAMPFALTGPTVYAWNEQTNVPVSAFLDLSTNPSNSGSPVNGFLNANVDSHFIHCEDYSGMAIMGTVTFSQPIIGVIYRDLWIDATDAGCGAGGTLYPTTVPQRGAGAASWIGINVNVLTFIYQPTPGIPGLEQARVFTHAVPAPGAMALAAIGGLLTVRRRRNSH